MIFLLFLVGKIIANSIELPLSHSGSHRSMASFDGTLKEVSATTVSMTTRLGADVTDFELELNLMNDWSWVEIGTAAGQYNTAADATTTVAANTTKRLTGLVETEGKILSTKLTFP